MSITSNFTKNQDRSYFNIYKPTRPLYDDVIPNQNIRAPLEPQSEVDRQTGTGLRQCNCSHMQGGRMLNLSQDGFRKNKLPNGLGEIYKESPQTQIHSKPLEGIKIMPNIGGKNRDQLSMDDWKPFESTAKYYGTFRHVANNPLKVN